MSIEKGISAITRIVANELGVKRCLVCLDEDIDPEHSQLADRHDVIYELKYSQLVNILNGVTDDGDATTSSSLQKKVMDESHKEAQLIAQQLTEAIDNTITLKNEKRSTLGQEELADWYRKYALLQGMWCSFL